MHYPKVQRAWYFSQSMDEHNDLSLMILCRDEAFIQLEIQSLEKEVDYLKASKGTSASTLAVKAISLTDFLNMEIPPREFLLFPIIPEQGLVMLHAPRGIGKTFSALGIAYAVAVGGEFLRFRASKLRKVLYVDGEMPAYVMQERLHLTAKIMDTLTHSMCALAPQDEYEGQLIAQLVVLHDHAMQWLGRALRSDRADFANIYLNGASKQLTRHHEALDTLLKYRRRGEQRVHVEHVHVHGGGRQLLVLSLLGG
jgi:hypothetical protein